MPQTDLAKLLNFGASEPAAEKPAGPSQNEMLAQAIIGLAPILAGAAFGGSAGGAAGAQAGLSGLQAIQAGKKEQKQEEKEALAEKKQRMADILAAAKEERAASAEERAGRAEKRAEARQVAELGLRRKELELKETDAGKGSKLTSEQTQTIAAFDGANKQIEEIEKRIQENSDIMGPIAGIVSGKAGYGTKAKTFDARMKLAAQDIGKALEGGKLTDADIDRYRSMLPNLRDTPEVAFEKSQLLRELIATKRGAAIQAMGAGGYNVSRISPTEFVTTSAKARSLGTPSSLPSGLSTRDAMAAPPKPDFNKMSLEELKAYTGKK